MSLVLKIAWRNIMRHRGKSLVIGAILFVGALLMTVGNGVISGMDRGLEKNIVNGFTGHVVLVSDEQQSDNVFIEFMGKSIEPIFNFTSIDSALAGIDAIDRYLPIGKNAAMVLNEESGAPGFSYIIGVDFERYQQMFPDNIRAIEGRLLRPGETGVLAPTGARKEMFEYTTIWYVCEGCTPDTAHMPPEARDAYDNLAFKDNVVFMGMTADNTSTDVRLGIKGIIKYRALNTIYGHFSLVDIESYRQCLGYFTTSDKVELSEEEQQLLELEEGDIDNLFAEGELFADAATGVAVGQPRFETPDSVRYARTASADIDAGAYNMVLILLKDGRNLDQKVAMINSRLDERGLGVRAISWKKAMGMIGSMATLIKGALFVFVMLLFLVAIIIIINTLSMAAIERTSEIGMMRAVGARRAFISVMFFGETALLSFFFGGLGVLVGYVTVAVLRALHITTQNDMVQLLFGGDSFSPYLSAGDIGLVIVQLLIVTVLAVAYPMRVAQGITPLDAVSRE
jgi:putative ABC transport system permease protein